MLNVARQEFDTETIFAVILFILLFVAFIEVFIFAPLQRNSTARDNRGYDQAPAPRICSQHGIAEGVVVLALVGWWLTARGLPPSVLPGLPEVLLTAGTFFGRSRIYSTISG